MNLLCTEGNRIKNAYRDPVFLKDDRVLQNLLRMEEFYLIPARHLEQQKEVKPYMRRIVVQWMFEVRNVVGTVSALNILADYSFDV